MELPDIGFQNYSWVDLPGTKWRMIAACADPTGWVFIVYEGKKPIADGPASSEAEAIKQAEAWARDVGKLEAGKPLKWHQHRQQG